MEHLAFPGMPSFRDDDSNYVWIWDPSSSSYVKAPAHDQGPDIGHATGGDNDLFDPFQHTEHPGVPELEGYMSHVAGEWAPKGFVKCPNCTEITKEHLCPTCGKDLTPEWNVEGQQNEFMDVMPQHNDATDAQSWPQRVPKRNRQKTDDSYPSMSLSHFELAQHIARRTLSQDMWDDFFSGQEQQPAGKVEIGRWLIDKQGQLHFDHGMNSAHEAIAARDGIAYPSDVGVMGAVYNDGTAEVLHIFSDFQFNQQAAQAQLEQAFGPVHLEMPIGQNGEQQKGAVFQPFELHGGQWLIPPQRVATPITGVAWVKERSQGVAYHPNMILVCQHLVPEDFALFNQGAVAIITATGGMSSHAAYIASTDGVPVVVGIGEPYMQIETGNYLKIEPTTQTITVMPGATSATPPDQKQQIWDNYLQYQLQRGGSVTPKPEFFSHYDEEIAWREANSPRLESCPECHAPMIDQDGEAVCHDCGHKQPIIHHQAGALALEAVPEIAGALGGDAAAGAGAAEGGGLLGGIGGLMNKALGGGEGGIGSGIQRGLGIGAGEDLVRPGGSPSGGASTPYDTGAENAGVISSVRESGILSIIEGLVNVLQKAPEVMMDPKNPLSYVDDVASAAAGGAQAGGGTQTFASSDDTFGEDEVGLATKNRGDNSDPDDQNSSGSSPKEHGDSPEQLKDVNGDGGTKDSDAEDGLAEQGDPHLQQKALKAFHMNLPLVIEFAHSPESGSDNPILMALDQLLEEAFPGYKGGEEPGGATEEHPKDEASDEASDSEPSPKSEGDDKKSDPKEASLWHYAFDLPGVERDPATPNGWTPGGGQEGYVPGLDGPAAGAEPYSCPNCGYGTHNNEYTCPQCGTELVDNDDPRGDYFAQEEQAPGHYDLYGADQPTWKDMFPHEAGMNAITPGAGAPVAPGAMPQGAPGTPTICPRCGQFHLPGTPCPQQVQTPGAIGGQGEPINAQPAPGKVITKWKVVSTSPVEKFEESLKHLPEVTSEDNPNAENIVDSEFAFFAAEHEHHHVEHEIEHHQHDDPTDQDTDEASTPWVDDSGQPLVEGAQYEMHAQNYEIPDRVTVERILPDKLVYRLHSGDVDYTDEVTKEQLALDGTTFTQVDEDPSADFDSEAGFPDEHPIRPGQDATPQVDDLTSPSTVVSRADYAGLEEYTGSFKGDAPDARDWLMESSSGGVDVDPALMAKLAGKDYSPREQREFIDESGTARNLDRLQLEGTHYVVDDDLDTAFNW